MKNTPNTTPRAPATQVIRKLGLEPDAWQIEVLEAGHPRLLLNCCRQADKSTVVALLAMAEAVFVPGTRVLFCQSMGDNMWGNVVYRGNSRENNNAIDESGLKLGAGPIL